MNKDNIQELLKPRVKCIADFWDNPFKVGQIIQFTQEREYHDFITGELQGKDWLTDFLPDDETVTRYMYWMRKFIPYPHLFRHLEWWEDRDVKDMPEYVKLKAGSRVYKLSDANERYDYGFMFDGKFTEHHVAFAQTLPSTETEFLNQTPTP